MSTLYLPAWSIGPDCYKEVYEIVRPYGKKVAVIGGHTALSVAMPKLKAALEGTARRPMRTRRCWRPWTR